MKYEIEITAPVGSYESLYAAIQAGAKSVYFGAGGLNMRSKSSYNFTIDDLHNIQRIANENSIRTYLAVNTVVYDKDFAEMRQVVEAAQKAGITAIIASDISVVQYARSLGLTVHASTQLNISNIEAVEFYSNFVDVMVLARELSLEQVKYITQEIKNRNIKGPSGELVRIEVFAHGALCMAVSGKCYLSLHLHDHSANRGECLQPCRRKYEVTEREQGYSLEVDNEYIMSPKDLATIGFLDVIADAGVSILKIEGRGRSPEYVKRVVECYHEALDSINDGSYTFEKIQNWMLRLEEVFNRGFWDGYYLGRKLGEWNNIHGSSATKKKVFIGFVKQYYKIPKVAAVQVQAEDISVGDELMIIGNSSGVVEVSVQELRVDEEPKDKAQKGELCSFPVSEQVRPNDKVYKFVDAVRL